MIMTSPNTDPSYGLPPMPVTEPTMEQSFQLRRLQDLLPKAEKDDIITVLMALQRQNFALTNTIKQLLKEWPTRQTTTDAEPSKYGTLFVIKDFPTT